MGYLKKTIGNFENIVLNSLYEKLQDIYEQRREESLRKQCYCDKDVHFLEQAKIINERNIGSIRIGSGSYIRGEIHTFGRSGKISIGKECYIGEGTRIWSAKEVTIGNRVMIAHNCNIIDNDTHPFDSKLRNRQFHQIVTRGQPCIDLNEKKIEIEDDAWIAANCTILKGHRIGKGAIIGIGTIVNRDIPDYCLAYGNPLIIKQMEKD